MDIAGAVQITLQWRCSDHHQEHYVLCPSVTLVAFTGVNAVRIGQNSCHVHALSSLLLVHGRAQMVVTMAEKAERTCNCLFRCTLSLSLCAVHVRGCLPPPPPVLRCALSMTLTVIDSVMCFLSTCPAAWGLRQTERDKSVGSSASAPVEACG